MHAEDLRRDNCSNGQAIEHINKGLPHLDITPSFTFIIETINTIDTRTLVVASQDEKVFRIFDFVSKQQANRFERLLATIDIVS